MNRTPPLLAVLGLLLGCASDVPPACDRMCVAATAVYGSCLGAAGGWSAGGYDDADDFAGSCDTWAWEMRRLEDDAVQRGALDAPGAVAATCRARADALSDAAAAGDTASDAADSCAAFAAFDWHTPPWESE
jgi:hypothetical protein